MLRLTATDQSITMTTSATGSVDYISDWTDIVNATAVTTAGSGQGNVTTATTTTIIAAPASGSSRAVRSATISNRHGSTSNTIQLFKTVGATSYAISKPLVLLAGETVRFSDEGFCFVGNACALEVISATTAEQLESNATTGVMQIVGPAAGTTRVVTIPDANATMARTDSAQTFSGVQTFAGRAIFSDTTSSTSSTTGALVVSGGMGIAGDVYINGSIHTSNRLYSSRIYTDASDSVGGCNYGTLYVQPSDPASSRYYSTGRSITIYPNGQTQPVGYIAGADSGFNYYGQGDVTCAWGHSIFAYFGDGTNTPGTCTEGVAIRASIGYRLNCKVTSGTGLYVVSPSFQSGITVGEHHGIYVADQYSSAVGTTYALKIANQCGDYAIITGTGIHSFGDDVSLASGKYVTARYKSSDGSSGATGSFTTADSKTVTVKDGIITSIA